jgi:hypothetical protein
MNDPLIPPEGIFNPPTPQLGGLRNETGFKSPPLGDLGVKKFKIKFIILLFLIILILLPSCHHNRLKTSEKELGKEIITQEKAKNEAEKIALEKQKSDAPANLRSGSRYKEIRSVDPKNPPVRLDILGTGKNTREFMLSDIASSIRYVKLETPPDTMLLNDPFYFRDDHIATIVSDDEQIIYQGLYGLSCYDMAGKYLETVWKNESGIVDNGGGIMINNLFGISPIIPISLSEGNLHFFFEDGPGGKGFVMKYKPGIEKGFNVQPNNELKSRLQIPGDTLFNTTNIFSDRFDRIFGVSQGLWTGINNKWNAGKSGALLVTYNDSGDILCKFTDYDRIVNFSFGQYRCPVELTSYYYNGLLTIKPEYNDTIFRMIPPNRLLPSYIIDFGEFKVNFMEGLNPDLDLSGKYMLNSLHETDNFLFIRYTKNQDSPNNERKKAVKFYNVLFDKKQGKLFHQPGFTLLPEGIINNLDGGMPFWPEFITPKGEMMKLVSGKNIKDYLNSESFTKGPATSDQRRKQVSLANGLKDRDMIVIIVK